MGSRSLQFAHAARLIADETRSAGFVVPAFRSPPRGAEHDRGIRRHEDGTATVAVRLTGRPFVAVLADMVEGVTVANQVGTGGGDALRRRLWTALAAGSGSLLGPDVGAAPSAARPTKSRRSEAPDAPPRPDVGVVGQAA